MVCVHCVQRAVLDALARSKPPRRSYVPGPVIVAFACGIILLVLAYVMVGMICFYNLCR